jgi:hypothetical protein
MRTLCLTIFFLFSCTSYAQVSLEKGQVAPEAGIFLTKEQAAKVIAEKQAAEQICKINLDSAVEQLKARCEYEKGLLNNELFYEKSKFTEISKLRDVQDEKLYDRISDSGDNLYWFAGGIVAGAATAAAVSISIVLVINQVNP